MSAVMSIEYLLDEIEGDKSAELPEHLVSLKGNEWAVWRWAALRGAGFPAGRVLSLAAPACAAAADSLVQAEDEARQAQKEALTLLRQDLKAAEGERRGALDKAIRKLTKGKPSEPLSIECSAQAALDSFRAAHARLCAARAEFDQAYATARPQVAQAIRDVANLDSFREAIIWQNRRAYHTGIESVRRKSIDDTSSKQRQHQEMIASYLQRYCVKNDTIGFFGPVGWAKMNPLEERIAPRPGEELLAKRTVYLEPWCIDKLCETLSKDQALLPWMTPRRLPYVRLEGAKLYLEQPGAPGPISLPPTQSAALQACDGQRTAREIAWRLRSSYPSQFKTEMDVYRLLGILRNMGLLDWSVEVPFDWEPAKQLRARLEKVGDERLKQRALRVLQEMEDARAEVARAAGKPEELDAALTRMEETFTRLTGEKGERGAGKTYAGRTLAFEDCRRNIEVEIGSEVLENLGKPLSLLLTSARWFSYEVAQRYREVLTGIYRDLARENASAVVSASVFWAKAAPLLLLDEEIPMLDELMALFQKRWAEILEISPEQRRVQFDSDDLRARVEEVFACPAPGWEMAQYHSPDIMIAATGPEAIRRGEYYFVMGELHMGKNTIDSDIFVKQHPAPEELIEATAADLRKPRILPIQLKQSSGHIRGLLNADLPTDYFLEFGYCGPVTRRARALPTGDLVMEMKGEELFVRTRDRRLQFDIIEFFGFVLSNLVLNCFRNLRTSNHIPRVTIDRLVINREWWCFSAPELDWANEKDEAARFIAVRRWAQGQGLPRFVFIKSPVEKKPFYVDFDSPIYISMFAKTVRATMENSSDDARITVTEMLPEHDETWLPDGEGQRYTSELRIVAVDLSARDGASGQ